MKVEKTIAALSIAGALAIGFVIYGAMNTVSAVSIKNNVRINSSTAMQSDENGSEANPNTTQYSRFGYGRMGGGYGMMGGAYSYGSQATVTESTIQNDAAAVQQNSQVNEQTNAITYSGSSVKLVMEGGPEQADGKFVIDGLVNSNLPVSRACAKGDVR